jgi:hypothetical protein
MGSGKGRTKRSMSKTREEGKDARKTTYKVVGSWTTWPSGFAEGTQFLECSFKNFTTSGALTKK